MLRMSGDRQTDQQQLFDLWALRNELPETVRRYKAYTDQFEQWLIKTAIQREVEVAEIINTKAQKNKGKKGYRLAIGQQKQLVEAIASTNTPLNDTSGLLDLSDAIRSRKEVAEYHRFQNSEDDGHAYFNLNLEGFMTSLSRLVVPKMFRSEEPKEKSPVTYLLRFGGPDTVAEEQNERLKKMREEEDEDVEVEDDSQPRPVPVPPKKKNPDEQPMTEAETLLQTEHTLICFLYNYNRLRLVVRDTWDAYHNGEITAVTAGLVTDLVQSHLHQDVNAITEELELRPGELPILLHTLQKKLNTPHDHPAQAADGIVEVHHVRYLFAYEGTYLFLRYHRKDAPPGPLDAEGKPHKHWASNWIHFYDLIRKSELKLPKWDHFTEEILMHPSPSRSYLPLGLQIILDVIDITNPDSRKLLFDLREHGLEVSNCIRLHIEFEDRMWANDNKPDYFTSEEVKFSNTYLATATHLLEWVQELIKSKTGPDGEQIMTAGVFVTLHATLAGMSMWHFNVSYQGAAIVKTQWFVNALAHLYNAARQIGGLDLEWPDLEFLIKTQGEKRIFQGDRPTSPDDFFSRFLLSSTAVSSRAFASDYRHGNTKSQHMPNMSSSAQKNHGFIPDLPLEMKIREFYTTNSTDENRWIRRHAVFNYLHTKREESTPVADSKEVLTRLEDLRKAFKSFTTKISPPKPKKRKGKKSKPKVNKPDFWSQDETHADLLTTMRTELAANEVHNNFDYLSFYRRAFTLVMAIREKVLLGDRLRSLHATHVDEEKEPSNFTLICELFREMRIGEKTRAEKEDEEKGLGTQLSTKVVPVGQLGAVTDMIRDLIGREGGEELKRAQLRRDRDWEGLKAAYAAEEEKEAAVGGDVVLAAE
ncbi:hypothetical protein Alg130_04042 [Pyrenophora tritici-repentis]|uniref:NahD, 2-hydroxychromene-2-carboxylate isomerase n=2 Tax=Pyrenophora tritici-repentis TaxID=45151 RepID=A0A2W1FBA8_9PLEO|nr:uncharacterized protein PTRG_02784 [Pyrenophora tritici-repentis Pt-1C-BFP]KAF7574743.1 NahD, 2-hydroxychromene-2-carboxylate isomerase [Pyrenophora tritici-repentis]EDU45307.1 predicted protein [Pyrenophora tritici-repentis Pt-1C-BFP]KAI0586946.1 hypothetical protein Alg130_04042 [Pyrenophora tritici-repentis]KAI0589742.1 hypothetical protein Alg215_00204 [Pyrenophora tritici-repentis]KAI1553427.1 hypothetical protein PtrSN001C_000170 [Pyrenophora tritici-repentis]